MGLRFLRVVVKQTSAKKCFLLIYMYYNIQEKLIKFGYELISAYNFVIQLRNSLPYKVSSLQLLINLFLLFTFLSLLLFNHCHSKIINTIVIISNSFFCLRFGGRRIRRW